ncbi:12632_t:CDS:2 [Funneliformis mosseae]|uniref:12632_t:CDS:1 n=1 Tax=Funneliformis mosseae TaxID=27381 RepID=A0A9N9GS80_FUNMO|nr:12632_t:CDS:2 [Funneliformis mosseae]
MSQSETSSLLLLSRSGISKRSLLESLNIPDTAFEQASRLCVGMQFDHWNHANLVLLTYGQQTGFVWRIQDKYLDKIGGVYKQSVKTECTCFINMCWPLKSPGPPITKMNLAHYGHTLNPETIIQLLFGEFKDQLFLDKDLANAIQHFRKGDPRDSEQDPENDASNLLKELQKLKKSDPTWEFNAAEYRDYLSDLPFSIASSSAVRVFPKLVESLKEFLTDEVFHFQKAQIDVCFEYYSKIIPFEQYGDCDNIDEFDTSACIEDSIDKSQVALKSLINHVNITNILEIWEVKHMATNTSSTNYVALCHDYSHICTCLLLISEGLVCRHFFQVMLRIQTAKFAITLIKNRWYKILTYKILIPYRIYHQETNTATENSALNSIYEIQNLRQECLNQDPEIDHSIMK